MHSIVNSLSNYSTFFTRNDLQPLLPPQTRKIVAVAALAFACLAAAVYIGMRCFKAHKIEEVDPKFPSEGSEKPDKAPNTPAEQFNELDKSPETPAEQFNELDKSPETIPEEFKEKEIEFKQQFDQAKTVSEKLTICQEFSKAIDAFKSQSLKYKSLNKEIQAAAEKLIIDMVIDINNINLSSEKLDSAQLQQLKFYKDFIEILAKTEEIIAAKSKDTAQAAKNRQILINRYNLNPSDTTLEVDKKKNAQNCILTEKSYREKFEVLYDQLFRTYSILVFVSKPYDSPEGIYKILRDQLQTLAGAPLEPDGSYNMI